MLPQCCVVVTNGALTAGCVEIARASLARQGHEVIVFNADGHGGPAMEARIHAGRVSGVMDVTTTELAAQMVGSPCAAGPDRFTAAALRAVPQVVSVGGLDAVQFRGWDSVPPGYRGRSFHCPAGAVLYMRTTPEENDALGREIAHKASASAGPVTVLFPLRGLSALDAARQPFWWPEANAALLQSLRNWLSPHVQLVELDAHINEPGFAEAMVQTLLQLMACERAG